MTQLQTEISLKESLDSKEQSLLIPGFEVPLTSEEADALGAFEETALSYEDALAAAFDTLEAAHD
jgi:hypothetical protein